MSLINNPLASRTLANRFSILVMLLVVSWCVMTFTHEMGHVVGGWVGGGILTRIDLVPWHLPYSIHHPDPSPLITLWAGPILGIIVPCLFSVLIRHHWSIFIADFCLLANGGYLALAWIAGDRLLDTQRLLDSGSSEITIVIYCVLTIGIGYVRFRRDCIGVLSKNPAAQTERKKTR